MKKCPYCAENIKDEAILCKHCGKELNQDKQIDKMAIWAFILGIASPFLASMTIGVVTGFVAFILGIASLKVINKENSGGKGIAVTAIILGAIYGLAYPIIMVLIQQGY
jgi:uncharacterized membrane protein YvbJ